LHGRSSNAVGAVRESGYAALVLDRLARHTCGVVSAEAAGVVVRDLADPEVVITAAGCGVASERVGERLTLRRGVMHEVMSTARAQLVASTDELAELAGDAVEPHATGVCVPICWSNDVRGAVWAVAAPDARFEVRRIARLHQMARLAATAIQHAERHERLEASAEVGAEALAAAIEARDGYTGEHSSDVVTLALDVGEALEMDRVSLVELGCAARLHDVGKIAVPDEILHKPAALSDAEWRTMRRHAEDGAEILARVPGLEAVAAIVRFHHERWDGDGYPDGLVGAEIPLASRIIAACDAFRAMTTDRPYRRRMPPSTALEELHAASGSQFDASVVEALEAVVRGRRP
jgi:hypothetical protein